MADFLNGFRAKRREHEAHMEELQRGGRVIGSPMSPTPEPDAPANHREPPSNASPKSPKKKKKRKKHHRKHTDSDPAEPTDPADAADADNAPSREHKKKHRGKKKSRSNKANGVQSPDGEQARGSPPSAQLPITNGVTEQPPTLSYEAAEQESAAGSSMGSLHQVSPRQLKTEPFVEPSPSPDIDVPDNELPFRIADNSIVDGYRARQKSPFIHKREMSIADNPDPEPDSDDEASLPHLQPSQVKPEPPSSESESDLASPSAARLARLSRSRSRSVSRPPTLNKPTDQNPFAGGRSPSLAPSRSSTGSNQSIPARTQEPRPASRASTRSSARQDVPVIGDPMDVDAPNLANGHASPEKKQPRRPKSARKPKNYQQIELLIAETTDAEQGSSRQHQSQNTTSSTSVEKVSDWLAQPARRRTHVDVIEESDHDDVELGAEAIRHTVDEDEGDMEQAIQSQLQEQAGAQDIEPPAVNKPEVSAGQPQKAKKKRCLHSNNSLSLSQLEDDFGEGENHIQSRISLSQKSKLKDVMRGDANSPREIDPSPKQSKPKRKRRTNEVSEDEMENLLAGPSRRKKSKKTNKSLGASDDERTEARPKRKRLPQGETATGPWTTEELTALGQVVDQFRRSYDMDQQEVNAMIHERPQYTNPMHKEFWEGAVAAIPKRSRKQIVERTRRLYNNFVGRGRWTTVQKEELHELFQKHGTKFVVISGLINRDQKDIRDYWRNHYVVFEQQRKYYWKSDETEKLKQAVEEALHKIRIQRENNDQFRPRPRAKGLDDESLLDWQQISSAIGLIRSRQQCRWKWQEMKDKGAVGEENEHLPKPAPESRTINGVSEALANAREDYRLMSDEEKVQLIEAIHDSGAASDSKIPWKSLVDERFRKKWRRPTLKLVWFRLRKQVPNHEEQDVETNARYLLNYNNVQQSLPLIEDHQADDQAEEKLVNGAPGSKLWRTASQEPRAVRERQRRSSSASSRASSRAREKVSSEILRLPRGADQERGRKRSPRLGSPDLGQEDVGAAEGVPQPSASKRKGKSSRGRNGEEGVPVRVPKHLNGEAAAEQ
ncbi:hypothetical protein KVR01_012490 [Diaporthe batatas]|uniref:uncharacterized protein n=1 Tax=Diaporthe batatas TaxID=748121 RepID=UPI001D04C3F8|nr:uncharacterized protein KVR01_012490 [Diaporthe batatas]KAG8157828.1 hypothetical protein KVR01_012490 [Diaporthe batatas]